MSAKVVALVPSIFSDLLFLDWLIILCIIGLLVECHCFKMIIYNLSVDVVV